MEPQIRADLFFGTAYGLAVSTFIWVLALHAPPLDATNLLLLTAAAAAGTVRWRLRFVGKLPAAYALVLAALRHSSDCLSRLVHLHGEPTAMKVIGGSQARDTSTENRDRRAISPT